MLKFFRNNNLKMKKILSLIAVPFILTGCFSSGSDDTNIPTVDKKAYEGTNFTVQIPLDWEVIEPGNFTSGFPTQTQVAFLNNIRHEIFTANANVTIREIAENTSATDFAKNMANSAKNSLLGYEELSNAEKVVMQGENEVSAMVYEFQGKKSASDSIIRFKELYIVANNQGIVLTVSHLPEEDETVVNLLNEMLDSFALK